MKNVKRQMTNDQVATARGSVREWYLELSPRA